jgi:hypothetical protein
VEQKLDSNLLIMPGFIFKHSADLKPNKLFFPCFSMDPELGTGPVEVFTMPEQVTYLFFIVTLHVKTSSESVIFNYILFYNIFRYRSLPKKYRSQTILPQRKRKTKHLRRICSVKIRRKWSRMLSRRKRKGRKAPPHRKMKEEMGRQEKRRWEREREKERRKRNQRRSEIDLATVTCSI